MIRALAACALVLALVIPAAATEAHWVLTGSASVSDGDTIEIGDDVVRLFGIDAAELSQSCSTKGKTRWRCGTQARNRLIEIIDDRYVRCAGNQRDNYGRLLARCTVDGGAIDLGGTLVLEGLAWAFRRYSDLYIAEEEDARAARRGVWRAPTQPPWEFRAARWNSASQKAPEGNCPIKGNISFDGERIYHTPWSPWYDRTIIRPEYGERWFCDEAEALAAGWRAPRR
jgi:endonuclease YncB( thermonuclease family)